MLIDRILPNYDVVERHQALVRAPVWRGWEAVKQLNLARSPVVVLLLALRSVPRLVTGRGLPPIRRIDLESLRGAGFVSLAEKPEEELVLGIVGHLWRPDSGVVPVGPEEFESFREPGMAKAAWNFSIEPAQGGCLVSTETRVLCTDEAARRRFLLYWRLVGPFSGFIRKRLLAMIRKDAEAADVAAGRAFTDRRQGGTR